jgi:hypothetical protein
MSENVLHPVRPAAVKETVTLLTPHLIRQIDEALQKVGAFGEVRLVVIKGRLRFIQIVRSEAIDGAGEG